MSLARHGSLDVPATTLVERRRHALPATDSPQLASIIIRTQAQFIGSTDRLRAFAALLDDTVRFFGAQFALLHEAEFNEANGSCNFNLLAQSRAAQDCAGELDPLLRQAATHAIPVPAETDCSPAADPQSSPVLVLPIRRDGAVIGTLTLVHGSGVMSAEDADTAQPICALIAQLLEVWQTTRLRRQDQESIARLSQVAQQMQNGIIITGAQGRIDWVNHAFLDDISLTSQEVLGRTPAEICEQIASDSDEARILAALLRRGDPFAGEFALVDRRTGRETWYEISGNPFLNPAGQAEGLLIMLVDITERRRMQRMKDDFISTVSHELRTPLTSIRGALALLDAGAGGALPSAVSEMVAIAHRNSGRLGQLIDDLLDLDKLSSGKLRIDVATHAVMPLIDETLQEHQAFAKSYDVEVRITQRADDAYVEVDATRLRQVLRNLLSNATKFSHSGGVVAISVQPSPESVLIHVQDNGVGIPESFHASVFERFAQADTTPGERVGTGLGLAISKELVEGMRGELTFASKVGVGSTFTISLPRREPTE